LHSVTVTVAQGTGPLHNSVLEAALEVLLFLEVTVKLSTARSLRSGPGPSLYLEKLRSTWGRGLSKSMTPEEAARIP
jgi:hypothetical protein